MEYKCRSRRFKADFNGFTRGFCDKMEKASKTKNKVKAGAKREFNPVFMMRAVLKKLWIIILAAAVAGGLTYAGTKLFIKPVYHSSFTAYINNKKDSSGAGRSSSDVKASQALVHTYSEIMTSRYVLRAAAETLDIPYSYGKMKSMVSTSINDETGIITVNVDTPSPELSLNLAQEVEKTSLAYTKNIVDGSTMQIIDHPVLPSGIYKPDYIKLAVLGAVAGALLAVILICIKQFFNDKVFSENELSERYNIPVVGVIPDMINTDKEKGGYIAYRAPDDKAAKAEG